MATITSANSTLAISITGLFQAPQNIKGYASDDAFTADALEMAEVVMGVDGHLSAGFVFSQVKQTITIMPDSPSIPFFDTWASAEKAVHEKYVANATAILPAVGKKYTMTNGYLTTVPVMPSVKKTLQPQVYVITWESVTGEAA
jgi:hypothetical protein